MTFPSKLPDALFHLRYLQVNRAGGIMATSKKQKTVFDFMQEASFDLSAGIQFETQEAFIAWATENFDEIATEALINFSLVSQKRSTKINRVGLTVPRFYEPSPRKLHELVSKLTPRVALPQL